MRKKDKYLVGLMIMATGEEKPQEAAVTLMVNGMLVTGFIISPEKWLKHCPDAAAVDAAFARAFAKQEGAAQDEGATDDLSLDYIHLRDAKYYVPGQTLFPSEGAGLFVRILLDAVDGFHSGYLKQN